MCDRCTPEREDRFRRKLKLRDELKSIPLNEFTVGELAPLEKVLGLAYEGGSGTLDPTEEDLKLLEDKIEERNRIARGRS